MRHNTYLDDLISSDSNTREFGCQRQQNISATRQKRRIVRRCMIGSLLAIKIRYVTQMSQHSTFISSFWNMKNQIKFIIYSVSHFLLFLKKKRKSSWINYLKYIIFVPCSGLSYIYCVKTGPSILCKWSSTMKWDVFDDDSLFIWHWPRF